MTDDDLQAIEARATAAYAGPWRKHQPQTNIYIRASDGTYIMNGIGYQRWAERERDADFIVHAREDIPALLAEVRQLRSALQQERARRTA